MNATDLGWAFLFLVIVGIVIAVGIVVGIIVAGRLDRLQAPRPVRPGDEAQAGARAAGATDDTDEEQAP